MHKVKYNKASIKPPCTNPYENYWVDSDRLILKFEFDGKVSHVLGCYREYPEQGYGEFKLDGHVHPNWSDCVTGWAYV